MDMNNNYNVINNLYNKAGFFEKYGGSLDWVKSGDSTEEREWINIFTKI